MKNKISIFVSSTDDEDCKHILDILSNQNDFRIAGVEKDETGTIIKSEQLKPDVLVMDLPPPGMGGEELAPIIHRRSPSTAIVMFCDKDEDNYACAALKAGISGFLLKEVDTDKLVPVVKIVFSGGYYISASITIRVFSAVTFMNNFPGQVTEQHRTLLSPAERGIVIDIAHGFSYEKIAKHLHFSAGTIKNYLSAIKRKTKLKNRIQIVVYSLVYGLISFDQLGFWENKPVKDNSDKKLPIDNFQIIQYNDENQEEQS